MNGFNNLPIELPAPVACRELAAHLTDADLTRPNEPARLATVAVELGLSQFAPAILAVADLQPADQSRALRALAAGVQA